MAQSHVATDTVDWLLDRLTAAWTDIPRVAAEIDGWDLMDQLNFTETWSLEIDRLSRLEQARREHEFTPEQIERYGHLRTLIAANASLLQQIMES